MVKVTPGSLSWSRKKWPTTAPTTAPTGPPTNRPAAAPLTLPQTDIFRPHWIHGDCNSKAAQANVRLPPWSNPCGGGKFSTDLASTLRHPKKTLLGGRIVKALTHDTAPVA